MYQYDSHCSHYQLRTHKVRLCLHEQHNKVWFDSDYLVELDSHLNSLELWPSKQTENRQE